MTGMPPTLQTLVAGALDRQESEAKAKGDRWSVRSLEERHDIANGTLGQIAKGKRKAVDLPTAKKVADALGLPQGRATEARRARQRAAAVRFNMRQGYAPSPSAGDVDFCM